MREDWRGQQLQSTLMCWRCDITRMTVLLHLGGLGQTDEVIDDGALYVDAETRLPLGPRRPTGMDAVRWSSWRALAQVVVPHRRYWMFRGAGGPRVMGMTPRLVSAESVGGALPAFVWPADLMVLRVGRRPALGRIGALLH